jgi:cellobiose phosphorylase
MFPDVSLRAPEDVMRANRRGQRALWRYGISGDDPIVLLQVSEPTHRPLMRELLLAHDFWHMHGLKVDLVVVNEHPAGYFDEFHEQLLELIHTTSRMPVHRPGGVYLLRAAQVAPEDSILLQAAAAVCLRGDRGSLGRQMEAAALEPRIPRPELRVTRRPESRWPARLHPANRRRPASLPTPTAASTRPATMSSTCTANSPRRSRGRTSWPIRGSASW